MGARELLRELVETADKCSELTDARAWDALEDAEKRETAAWRAARAYLAAPEPEQEGVTISLTPEQETELRRLWATEKPGPIFLSPVQRVGVPREPTDAMIEAAEEHYRTARGTESRRIGGSPNPEVVWRAMWDAAQDEAK